MVAAAGALEMTGGRRDELERLARSHIAPAREVRQAKALLWATDGVSDAEIARRCASTPKSVRRWRSRFAAEGTAAVGCIRAGRGRTRRSHTGRDVLAFFRWIDMHVDPDLEQRNQQRG